MSDGQKVLAILFRQARRLAEPIALSELKEHGALTGAPQSIVTVREEAREWLAERLER
jgi:hypothetical protein